jgi:phospholipid transport system substrate-binding protein
MMRRALLLVALLAAPLDSRAQGAGPLQPVTALDDGLLQVMKAGRATPFAQRAAMLRPIVQSSFALPAILAASVGLSYASLPPADRDALLDAFTDYTVASYAANFDAFSAQRFVVAPQTRAAGAEQIVDTSIVPASGSPTRLSYVMRQGPQGWQIVDVLVDGAISRVAVQRSDFRALLSGGSAQPLIAALRQRVTRLESGGGS